MNRCHRIGQERSVTTTSYFLRGSAEERLIAYRTREADGSADALSVLATSGDATKMPHHKRRAERKGTPPTRVEEASSNVGPHRRLRYIAGLTPFAQDADSD